MFINLTVRQSETIKENLSIAKFENLNVTKFRYVTIDDFFRGVRTIAMMEEIKIIDMTIERCSQDNLYDTFASVDGLIYWFIDQYPCYVKNFLLQGK